MIIDLRSDTLTKPTPAMLNAMFEAQVGDDVFEEDPTVRALEQQAAQMFGKESALFCTSGTMTNQVAIMAHCHPADEVICDAMAHIYYYEGGGIMANANASVSLLNGNRGRITASQIEERIKEDNIHYPRTRMVALENTMNKGGGAIYNLDEIKKIKTLCQANGLILHLDGARLFNALVATGQSAVDHGTLFDSISICLSKGLGAPVGSLILGTSDFIKKCERIRKRIGGGWRQAGYMAAAGIFALQNNIDRLADDHQRAKEIEAVLHGVPEIVDIMPVETNIIIFQLDPKITAKQYQDKLAAKGIKAFTFAHNKIRFVTHLDFGDDQLTVLRERLLAS